MRTAQNIIAQMDHPVVLFSSLEAPPDLPARVTYVQLPSDIVEGYTQPAGGALHYTPYDSRIFQRYQKLIDAWQTYGIRHMYVDVSMEVAVLAKLFGLRVSHKAQPGKRTDTAHSFGYAACDLLLALMPPAYDTPDNRHTTTPVRYTGGISRFHTRPFQPLDVCRRVAVIVSPQAERSVEAAVRALAAAAPSMQWDCIGFTMSDPPSNVQAHGVVGDPLPILTAADVVIGAGGNNTIMEIASLGKPFVCVPEPRPYDEQVAAAESLERLQAAVYSPALPTPETWPDILSRLRGIDGKAFTSLVSDDASAAAARAIIDAAQLP
jgi:UDP:flavonoid glycosyltransferase YjiC (YdhE family)